MSLSVAITRTIPLFPHGNFVQWDLLDPTETGTYLFNVYRSGSSGGPWTLLLEEEPDCYNYTDRLPVGSDPNEQDPNQLALSRAIFYKIAVTAPSGTRVEAVSSVEPRLNVRQRLLKRKILRDESVMLRHLNGVEAAVLKRRHWGSRCPKCFDKYTKGVAHAACTTCFGTGFVTGYFDPIVTLAKRAPAMPTSQITTEGKQDITLTRVMLLDAPAVRDDDVLVFLRDNRRFLVKNVTATELQTVSVHQTLMVSEIQRGDVVYRILVDNLRTPPLF